MKWWRKTQYPDMKHPKSYPLEHFIGDCCPDDIKSVAEGVVLTLENIVSQYTNKPFLADRGVPEHDVFARITDEEYSDFYDTVCDAAKIAREAFDCEELYDSVCNGESYLVMNFHQLQSHQNLILQRDLQPVLKNRQPFQKEDLHRWSQNKSLIN